MMYLPFKTAAVPLLLGLILGACSQDMPEQTPPPKTQPATPQTAAASVNSFNAKIAAISDCKEIQSLMKNTDDNLAQLNAQKDDPQVQTLLASFEERKSLLAQKQAQHCR